MLFDTVETTISEYMQPLYAARVLLENRCIAAPPPRLSADLDMSAPLLSLAV